MTDLEVAEEEGGGRGGGRRRSRFVGVEGVKEARNYGSLESHHCGIVLVLVIVAGAGKTLNPR